MKALRVIILLGIAAVLLQCPVSYAEDSCTEWSRQDDGTYFRICTDQNGHRYCQQKDASGNITVVPCT